MTKRHFELVARILRASLGHTSRHDVYQIAEAFAEEFERENPRFDRARFLQACGVTE